MQNKGGGEHIIAVVAIFAATLIIAILMLLFAVVLCLAELIGSLEGALLIIGALAAIVSAVLYYRSVRPHVELVRREMSAVYDIVSLVRGGYEWVMRRVELFIKDL